MKAMAARLAFGEPEVDPLTELQDLVKGCRQAVDMAASDYLEGRLSEEAYLSLSRSVQEAARSACESIRSRKNLVESVLRGRVTGKQPIQGWAEQP